MTKKKKKKTLNQRKMTLNLKVDYPSTVHGSLSFCRTKKQLSNGFGSYTVKEPVGLSAMRWA